MSNYQSRKEKTIILRKKGYSYSMISVKLGMSKSTLSNWLKDIPFVPNQEVIRRVGLAHLKSAKFKNNQKINMIQRVHKSAKIDIGKLNIRDLWFLGLGLYLGEGSKLYESIKIINSDPEVVLLAIRWFKIICNLKTKNITIAIHIYPDINEMKAKRYWSKITGLPLSQFRKTQIDKRIDKSYKKKRKLPYGTAHLTIVSNGKKKFGVFLHRKIIGWIKESLNQSKNMRV